VKAITVTDESAGTAGMALADRPDPQPAINVVFVRSTPPASFTPS
jgi:hypothetical protein